MKLSTIICTYLYETFKELTLSIKALEDALLTSLESIYVIARKVLYLATKTIKVFIDGCRDVLEAIFSNINALIDPLLDSTICTNMFKCDFIKLYLLNEDSVIGRSIRSKIGEDVADALLKAKTDYENFKEAICSNISYDSLVDIIIGVLEELYAKAKEYRNILAGYLQSIYEAINNYLDGCYAAKLIDLLEHILSLADCVLDESELCASVDTANSYYQNVLSKFKLFRDVTGRYTISPEYRDKCTATGKLYLAKLDSIINQVESGIAFTNNSRTNALVSKSFDLSTVIMGTVEGVCTGRASKIPVYKWASTTLKTLATAIKNIVSSTGSGYGEILSCITFEQDGIYYKYGTLEQVLLEIEASESEEVSLVSNRSLDRSEMQAMKSAVVIGDKVYSLAKATDLYIEGSDTEVCEYYSKINKFKDLMSTGSYLIA